MNYAKTFTLLGVLTAVFVGVGYLIAGPIGMVIAFLIGFGMNVWSYWNSDKLVLRMHGASEVTDDERSPMLRRFRTDTLELAKLAGMPAPKVYVMDNAQPNAFATGRNPDNAAVAATTGLLNTLTREETAGVMAHELAHVKNRDTLTMTVAASIAGAIAMLANFALLFRRNRGAGGAITAIAVMLIAPLAASVIQMAISRSREYEADRVGGEIVGNPLYLASALEKIAMGAKRIRNHTADRNPASAHLFIMNPLAGQGRDKLFSTHPNTQNRIDRLRAMAEQMGTQDTNPAVEKESISSDDVNQSNPWIR